MAPVRDHGGGIVSRPPYTDPKQRKARAATLRLTDKQHKTLTKRGGAEYVRRVLDTPIVPAHEVVT